MLKIFAIIFLIFLSIAQARARDLSWGEVQARGLNDEYRPREYKIRESDPSPRRDIQEEEDRARAEREEEASRRSRDEDQSRAIRDLQDQRDEADRRVRLERIEDQGSDRGEGKSLIKILGELE